MYLLNSEKVFYDTSDGESIVINFMTGNYYCFNKSGAAAFDFLVSGGDSAKLRFPDMDGLAVFLRTLREKEILTEDGTPCSDIPFDCSEAETPLITEYNEVKNLILADPVDDVVLDRKLWEQN